MDERLRAVADLMVSAMREGAGCHEYDGRVQDLSPAGVTAGLTRLRRARDDGPPQPDPHDEAQLRAFEEAVEVRFGELEEHRWNPYFHLDNLDLAPYDREYAPAEARDEARHRHVLAWPDAVDAAMAALDRVSAPVAQGLLGAVRGLGAALSPESVPGATAVELAAASEAHRRLVAHVERAAAEGDPDASLGSAALARLLGASEATAVDLGRLQERADAERDRLGAMLTDACAVVAPGAPVAEVVAQLLSDHPGAEGVITEARDQVDEVLAFTRRRGLVEELDGECWVGPAPPSRRWAMAMMSWAGPFEDDAPSWYHVTPPDEAWAPAEQEEWLEVFSRTTLPVITAHEVAPGHFAHGRALRRLGSEVRRALQSEAFVEGWAHYGEELCLDEGFRDGDPRVAVGVAIEGLTRVTRLACSIGIHSGAMTLAEAARRFEADAFLRGKAAASEAARGTFDPTYGRYTWGKLEILALRDEAQARWGRGWSLSRFHRRLLELGAPCLGLMGSILDGTA